MIGEGEFVVAIQIESLAKSGRGTGAEAVLKMCEVGEGSEAVAVGVTGRKGVLNNVGGHAVGQSRVGWVRRPTIFLRVSEKSLKQLMIGEGEFVVAIQIESLAKSGRGTGAEAVLQVREVDEGVAGELLIEHGTNPSPDYSCVVIM